jgi:hypothetical protein
VARMDLLDSIPGGLCHLHGSDVRYGEVVGESNQVSGSI